MLVYCVAIDVVMTGVASAASGNNDRQWRVMMTEDVSSVDTIIQLSRTTAIALVS